MNYIQVIDKKNKILCVVLAICIVLRCIVNSFFGSNFKSIIMLGVFGLLVTGIVSLIVWKSRYTIAVMFGMIAEEISTNVSNLKNRIETVTSGYIEIHEISNKLDEISN